jgi:hypothetical protein
MRNATVVNRELLQAGVRFEMVSEMQANIKRTGQPRDWRHGHRQAPRHPQGNYLSPPNAPRREKLSCNLGEDSSAVRRLEIPAFLCCCRLCFRWAVQHVGSRGAFRRSQQREPRAWLCLLVCKVSVPAAPQIICSAAPQVKPLVAHPSSRNYLGYYDCSTWRRIQGLVPAFFLIREDAAMNWYQPCFYSSDSAIEVGIRSLVISHDILFSLVPSIFIWSNLSFSSTWCSQV